MIKGRRTADRLSQGKHTANLLDAAFGRCGPSVAAVIQTTEGGPDRLLCI